MGRRELSFTLENDIYLRFQSFDSAAELESSIREKCPFKIDIGPVYSVDVWHNIIKLENYLTWFSHLYYALLSENDFFVAC